MDDCAHAGFAGGQTGNSGEKFRFPNRCLLDPVLSWGFSRVFFPLVRLQSCSFPRQKLDERPVVVVDVFVDVLGKETTG